MTEHRTKPRSGQYRPTYRLGPRPNRRPQDRVHRRPEAAVARAVRHRAAAFQPAPTCRAGWPIGSRNWPIGGLKPETVARLEALGEQLDGGKPQIRRVRQDDRPIAGTRLVREYQGVEHVVTVLADGFEWQGRPYRSLSAIARAITGTRWNGWTFFGLKNQRSGA